MVTTENTKQCMFVDGVAYEVLDTYSPDHFPETVPSVHERRQDVESILATYGERVMTVLDGVLVCVVRPL